MAKNRYYNGEKTEHFDGTRFYVPGYPFAKPLTDVLKWRFSGGKQKWPKDTAPFHFDQPPQRVLGNALRVSYIGHASMLIQTQGLNMLIDPVWAERASPLSFAGPKRVNPPGIKLEHLPPVDIVLISHNHYDHLDLETLKMLHESHAPSILTPLGNEKILNRISKNLRVETYDWGTRVPITPDLAVHFEPIYHWSARGIADRCMALWCAFVLETSGGNIYHIADTGYRDGKIFAAMREKHKNFRLAILPIGAYEPRWFMSDQHVNPQESVQIFKTIEPDFAIAHHWGTFQLTDEDIHSPQDALATALKAENIAPERFLTPRPGQFIDVPKTPDEG